MLRLRWLMPPGLSFGYHVTTLPGFTRPIYIARCRYSPSIEAIQNQLEFSMKFWGLTPADLEKYEIVFTYGPHECGSVKCANGCTWPWSRVTVALRPNGPTIWARTLTHEFGHVWDLKRGGDGDPDHLLNYIWDRIPLYHAKSFKFK
jgi:hypothetical protein